MDFIAGRIDLAEGAVGAGQASLAGKAGSAFKSKAAWSRWRSSAKAGFQQIKKTARSGDSLGARVSGAHAKGQRARAGRWRR